MVDDVPVPGRTVEEQVERLVELGVPAVAGVDADDVRRWGRALAGAGDEARGPAYVVVHPSLTPTRALVPLLTRSDRAGFVVPDLTDLEDFADIEGIDAPRAPLYLVTGVQRGDELAGRSPDEALPAITGAGRSPMTVAEGVSWLLQDPDALAPNRCFMTIGSRRPTGTGPDKRTPALWISGGADRDGGKARRGAPKLGWCWAGNRHTWLGFASVAARFAPTSRSSVPGPARPTRASDR